MQRLEKTRAFLTEFIIVILFFTISSVITVRLFVSANKKSSESVVLTKASIMAETLAEEIRAGIDCGSDYVIKTVMVDENSYIQADTGENYYRYFDKNLNEVSADEAYIVSTVSVYRKEARAGTLYTAEIKFSYSDSDITDIKVKILSTD